MAEAHFALLWDSRPLDSPGGVPSKPPWCGLLEWTRGKEGRPDQLSVSISEEAEDPACIPIFWVSKWVDYSDKYGLGRFLLEWVDGSGAAK